MSSLRTVLSASGIVGILGVGFGMWFAMAPGEEQRKERCRAMPESNPMRMEETRKRNALMMLVLKEAAESQDNLARDPRK